MAGRKGKKLTDKQQLFVKEYLVDLNASQAALRAGYSPKTAYSIGDENLKKPEIQKAIQEAIEKRAARVELTADNVLRELKDLVFSNPKNFYGESGRLLSVSDMPDEVAKTVHSHKVLKTEFNVSDGGETFTPVQTVEVKGVDKLKAIEMAMKHLGMFELDNRQKDKDIEINVNINGTDGD